MGKLLRLKMVSRTLKSARSERLTDLIRRYAIGKLTEEEMTTEMELIYNRSGDERRSIGSDDIGAAGVLDKDEIYERVYELVSNKFPVRGEIREDQAESYTNTVSAKAVTLERLGEYQQRGVEYVKVVAYIDEATTDICRNMNGRIFAVGNALQSSIKQGNLAHPESFWTGNNNFGQEPTSNMEALMPPYHYNCRTRVVPYYAPANDYEAAIDNYNNLVKLTTQQVEAIVGKVKGYEYASRDKLLGHFKKHQEYFGAGSVQEYNQLVQELLQSPLKQMGVAISARDKSLNLYVWSSKIRQVNAMAMHDFAVFDLDKKRLKTFHPKTIEKIMQNLDSKVHGKVMMLSDQYVSKGDTNMVVEYEVKCYEYILDYFDTDDTTDEQEIISRLMMEKEWDTIPEDFKKRILAVDKIVIDKYADWFDYWLFKEYIRVIRARQKAISSGMLGE